MGGRKEGKKEITVGEEERTDYVGDQTMRTSLSAVANQLKAILLVNS